MGGEDGDNKFTDRSTTAASSDNTKRGSCWSEKCDPIDQRNLHCPTNLNMGNQHSQLNRPDHRLNVRSDKIASISDSYSASQVRATQPMELRDPLSKTNINDSTIGTTKAHRSTPKIRFRVLIIGRANAGKTSILQRLCQTTEHPIVYQKTYRDDREKYFKVRVGVKLFFRS